LVSGMMSMVELKSNTQALAFVGFTSDSGGAQFGAVVLKARVSRPVGKLVDTGTMKLPVKLPGKVVPELPFTPRLGMMPVLANSRSRARTRCWRRVSNEPQKLNLSFSRSPKPKMTEPPSLAPPSCLGLVISATIWPPRKLDLVMKLITPPMASVP